MKLLESMLPLQAIYKYNKYIFMPQEHTNWKKRIINVEKSYWNA